MEMRFLEAAEAFLSSGRDLLPFAPFPAATDREAYEALPDALKQEIIAEGENVLGFPYPPIHATDFMAFRRTGNRINYEDIYFGRRYALNSLVLAECVENKGRFLDDIINGIFVLCEESGWQLPPHNSYIRNTPQEILPDATRPVLDLFACETGAQLACICYLLKGKLDEISPFITKRIFSELTHRIYEPYLKEHFWWMGKGEEPMGNWTPWCTQNVLLSVFLVPGCSPESQKSVLQKAAGSLDYFLKDYGEDGCCDEGAQYFRRAGLCLDAAADLLNQVTGGAFTRLYTLEKIRNIASYIVNVHIEGKYYFNFADCSPVAGRAGVREYLFGKRTGQPELMLFAAKDFQTARKELIEEETYRLSLYYRLTDAFFYRELMSFATEKKLPGKDIFYPSIGLFIARGNSLCLAVKAGDNDHNHNHNDTGSLTLYKNGSPILADIGVESYCAKTFSSERYEIWTMQSGYHNLPSLNGLDEQAGAEYHATEVFTEYKEDFAAISMELSGAYPLTDKSLNYVRQVTLDKKEDTVTLSDCTNCQDVVLHFITYYKPAVTDSHMEIGSAKVSFEGAKLLTVETLPITDKRLQTAWDHDLYRICLKMDAPRFRMIIH